MGAKETESTLTFRQQQFLTALSQARGNVAEALRMTGYSSGTYHTWVEKSPEFRWHRKRVARELLDAHDAEADRRALQGVERKKFYKGKPIRDPETKQQYAEREYSDGLLMYRSKVLARILGLTEYEDRQNVNVELNGTIKERIDRLAKAITGGSPGEGTGGAGEAIRGVAGSGNGAVEAPAQPVAEAETLPGP